MYHPCGEQMEDTMSSIYPYLHSGRTENHQPVIQREGLHGCIRRTSHAFSPSARYCLPDKWQRENALDTYEATFLERQATHTRARALSLSPSLSLFLLSFVYFVFSIVRVAYERRMSGMQLKVERNCQCIPSIVVSFRSLKNFPLFSLFFIHVLLTCSSNV